MAIRKVLQHHAFDNCMGLVIMVNMALIIIETDHAAHNDDPLEWVETLGWLILVIFILELVLRVFVYRIEFFKDGWNLFDFSIIATDSLFSFLGAMLGNVFPMSMLRIFRLAKLARVSKVFRVFPELRVMMAGLAGSLRAIFWGTMLLAFVVFVWAIIAVQFIHPLNKELADRHIRDECERCPRAYESVLQATLTFCQQVVAGDSWGKHTIPVIEAHPWTALYFMAVFLTVSVSVMNLILGVVVNVALSESEGLQGELAEEQKIMKMSATNEILEICKEMDVDGDGELSEMELRGFQDSMEFRTAMKKLNLTQEDLTIAFQTMDTGGTVSYHEFVRKLYKMKDSDAQFMLERIQYLIIQVRDHVVDNMKKTEETMVELEKQELSILDKVLHQGITSPKAEDNKAEVVSDFEEKEKKQLLVGWPSALETCSRCALETKHTWKGLEGKSVADVELQIAAGGPGLVKEVLAELLQASTHFQADFKDSLQHLASNLEVHATSTKLLSRLVSPQTPRDELLALPPSLNRTTGLPLPPSLSRTNGFEPPPSVKVCCGGD